MCSGCGIVHQPEGFSGPRTKTCISCTNKRRALYQYRNAEKFKIAKIEKAYDITGKEYKALLESQNHVCAICLQPPKWVNNNKTLVVDHCHGSNKVRGLLCHNCNRGLGLMHDSSENLRRAADYLDKFNGK